jgi:hypothetical protein
MIGPWYRALRGRRWDRHRRRHISEMRRLEQAARAHMVESLEAMAIQLAEIRGLPEVSEPCG